VYIVLLGAPGAGKGTQAAVIARETGAVSIATGDLFRQALARGTELGKQAQAYMEKGLLVPDEITIRMLEDRMAAPDTGSGVILDGFPRNLAQAGALDRTLQKQSRAIDRVVYIKVPEEELLRRLSGRWVCRNCQSPYHEVDSPPRVAGRCDRCGGELYQRPDDRRDTVKKRLQVYFAETAPVIDYYRQAGKLLTVDGTGSAAEVSRRIIAALKDGKFASV